MAVGTGGTILSYGYGTQPPPTLTPTPAATTVGEPTATPTAPGGQNAELSEWQTLTYRA